MRQPSPAEPYDSCEEQDHERRPRSWTTALPTSTPGAMWLGARSSGHAALSAQPWHDRMHDRRTRGDGGEESKVARRQLLRCDVLDAIDLRLLEELQTNGRKGIAELGDQVGMSAPAIAERVQPPRASRVITGLSTELDPAALGYRFRRSIGSSLAGAALARARGGCGLAGGRRVLLDHGRRTVLVRLQLRWIDDLEEILDRFTTLRTGDDLDRRFHAVPPAAHPRRYNLHTTLIRFRQCGRG